MNHNNFGVVDEKEVCNFWSASNGIPCTSASDISDERVRNLIGKCTDDLRAFLMQNYDEEVMLLIDLSTHVYVLQNLQRVICHLKQESPLITNAELLNSEDCRQHSERSAIVTMRHLDPPPAPNLLSLLRHGVSEDATHPYPYTRESSTQSNERSDAGFEGSELPQGSFTSFHPPLFALDSASNTNTHASDLARQHFDCIHLQQAREIGVTPADLYQLRHT